MNDPLVSRAKHSERRARSIGLSNATPRKTGDEATRRSTLVGDVTVTAVEAVVAATVMTDGKTTPHKQNRRNGMVSDDNDMKTAPFGNTFNRCSV